MPMVARIPTPALASVNPRLSPQSLGFALGIAAALIWGGYLAMARAGASSGLNAADIAALRYGVAGAIVAPWWLRNNPLSFAGVGAARALALAVFAGPLFVLLGAGGYRFAPLAHGAVLQPAGLTLGAMLAATILFGERLTAARVVGIGAILTGLAVIAGPGLWQGGATVPLGDAMFAGAGLMWAAFTILSKRWGVNPIAGTAAVSIVSAAIYAPIYLISVGWRHLASVPPTILGPQVVVQGVLTGVLAVIAYSRAVQLLGPGRAAVFPALVPAAAILLGVPVAGEWPNTLQLTGLALVTAGLLIAIGLLRAPAWTRGRR